MNRVIECWEVHDNFSEDGMDPRLERVLGCFSTYKVAAEYARGRGNYGNAAVVTHRTFTVSDTFQDAEEARDADIRRRALEKLTDDELRVLGLQKGK